MIRAARFEDVEALVELENRCFDSDRLSARSFRHLIKKGNDELLVTEVDGLMLGYALTLFRRNTSLARLYSIAVAPEARGQSLGYELVMASQQAALAHGATRMRLEVRQDNLAAQALYRKLGYRDFGLLEDYYDDHETALRMEKTLAPRLARGLRRVPWYPQTLDFTCGPACLMMAMKTLDPKLKLDRQLELQLWREATTVYMTSGHGGCSPKGLALSASRRGFPVRIWVSDETEMFTDSVRSEDKKEVIRLVESGFRRQLDLARVRVGRRARRALELKQALAEGGLPLLLISSYRLHGDRVPHWVLLTAADERFLYINDPFVDSEKGQVDTDCFGIPIAPVELERMMRLGRRKHHACVVIYPRREEAA